MPRLTVVVLNWNRENETASCVEGLARWRRLAPEVVVVDNGSREGEGDRLAARFPEVRVLRSPSNLGFGGGNNLALRRLESGYVLLLNNDAVLAEEAALELMEALDRDPRLGVVGPLLAEARRPEEIVSAGGRDVSRHVRTHLRLDELPREPLWEGGPVAVDYVPGTAVLLRSDPLRSVGGLDEEYFFGAELADLCERFGRMGLISAVVPTAVALHDSSAASELRECLYPYYILRNRFRFAALHRRPLWLYRAAWSIYGLLKALTSMAAGRRQRARALVYGLWDGLRGRWGDRNRLFVR